MSRSRLLSLAMAATVLLFAGPARAGLLAHWAFDETSGSTAFDGVGAADGTLAGAATFVPAGGVVGGAISLHKATSDLVNMGDVFNFGSTDFSLSFWVNTTVTDVDSVVVARHLSGTAAGYLFNVNTTATYGSPNKVMFYTSNSPGGEVISTTSVNDGSWHHVVGVYQQGVSKRMFVDGAPAEAATGAGGNGTIGAPFLVGGVSFGGTPTALLNGMVDELRVYDHALTDPEVQTLFDCPSGSCATTTTTTTSTTTTMLIEELCGASPRPSCDTAAPRKGGLKIKVKGGGKDLLKWKLAAGAEAAPEDFGNPVMGSPEYAFCLYDDSMVAQPRFLAPLAAGTGWKVAGAGYAFSSKTGNAAGLTGVKLLPGAQGKTLVQVKAKGSNLTLPALPFAGDVHAQFVARDGATTNCWDVTFTAPKKNDAGGYSAKGPAAP
jgi:hypothetical protein